jgi:GAF domain-containing protein
MVAATREARILHGEQGTPAPRDRAAIHSAVSLPLELEDGSLVGVLNLSTSVHGQHFHEAHVRLLQKLAPRCAVLLQESVRCASQDDAAAEKRLVELLHELEESDADLSGTLQTLCSFTRQEIVADSLQLLLCHRDGRWLVLAQDAPGHSHIETPRPQVADQILAARRWELVADPDAHTSSATPTGSDTDPVEEALESKRRARTLVFAPLIGTAPLGLVVASFASASGAERFLRIGRRPMRDLALIVESCLQQERAQERVMMLSRLAHSLPGLLQARRQDNLPRQILEQARHLVAARRAAFRHVDMANRRYSPPVCLGVSEEEWEAWRHHDARLTEETLQHNESRMTARISESSAAKSQPGVHTSLSVPIRNQDKVLGVLNVYDKEPRAPWSDRLFTAFDRDILESLAVLLATLLPSGAPEEAPPPSRVGSATRRQPEH